MSGGPAIPGSIWTWTEKSFFRAMFRFARCSVLLNDVPFCPTICFARYSVSPNDVPFPPMFRFSDRGLVSHNNVPFRPKFRFAQPLVLCDVSFRPMFNLTLNVANTVYVRPQDACNNFIDDKYIGRYTYNTCHASHGQCIQNVYKDGSDAFPKCT